MKMILLLTGFLLLGCRTSENVEIEDFTLKFYTETFHYKNALYIRYYGDHTDSVYVDLNATDKARITQLYNTHKMYDFRKNYKITPKLFDIPSWPETQILLPNGVTLIFEHGSKYRIKDYFVKERVSNFCKGVMKIVESKPEVKALEPTDIFFF